MKQELPNTTIRLMLYLLAPQKWKLSFFVLLCFTMGLVPSVDSVFFKWIIDEIESIEDVSQVINILWPWVIFYFIWWEGVNWAWRLYDYTFLKSVPFVKVGAIDQFYNYIQHHSSEFFKEHLVGYIANRISEASEALYECFYNLTEKLAMKVSIIGTSIIAVYFVHVKIGLVMLIWVSIFAALSIFFASHATKLSASFANNRGLISGKIVDAISNIGSVRMFSSYDHERAYLQNYLDKTVESHQALEWYMLKVRYVQGFSCSILIGTVIYNLISLRAEGVISIGDIVQVMTLLIVIAENIWDLMEEIGEFFEKLGSFNQSLKMISPYIIKDKENASRLKVTDASISFHNVSFNYESDPNLFTDKNLKIDGGSKVGLVGFTGSGKSTLVSLICRLNDVTSGSIKIDGQDVRDVTLKSLRDNISLIPQEPTLFQRSIMDNIKYGSKNATKEMVYEAAKKAHVHDEILALPKGYNTICSERGAGLSGGQRQRIIIARAILKDADILILDEATSALDNITEKLIKKSLDYLMKGRTVIVVAHRLSTLLDMDRILVFEKGKIVEEGTHNSLLRAKGLYKKLWDSQVQGFIPDQENEE